MQYLTFLYKKGKILNLYLWLVVLYSVTTLIIDKYYVQDSFYFNSYGESFATEQIAKIRAYKERFSWVVYLANPIFLIIKLSLTSCCIYIGMYFAQIKFRFENIFRVVVISEVIFLLGKIIMIFLIFQSDIDTFQELQNFSFFSLNSVIENDLEVFFYPLNTINIFEIIYWFLLPFGLMQIQKLNYFKLFGIVMASYGPGLLLWMLIVVFIALFYS